MKKAKVKKMQAICIGLLLLFGAVQAQQVTVTGRVDDSENKPMPGVTVLVRGAQQGTTTDVKGNYTLTNVTSSSVIIYSFIGYTSVEEKVGDRSTINIVLAENVSVMDEVVVIGYGTVKKRDLTGSVSSVRADVIPLTSVASVTQSLQGKAAGLIVMQNSAQPGGGLDILIRGQSSINAGNEPLYIVDGFPIVTLDQPNASSDGRTATGTQGPLNFLNPSDIVSIEVLKDASATAIYGSRAANGVILITTARGKEGKPEITFSATTGIQKYKDKWDTFSDVGDWMNEVNVATFESWLGERAVYPYGGDPTGANRKTLEQALAETDGTVDQWKLETEANGDRIRGSQIFSDAEVAANMGKQGTDWVSKIVDLGVVQNYNLSLRGGTNATRYMASLGYFDHDGIIKNSRLRRYTGRFNFDQDFGKRIKAQITVLGSRTNNDNIPIGTGLYENSGLLRSAIEYNPSISADQQPDGSFLVNPIVGNQPNPVSLLYVTDNTITDRVLANSSLTIEPIDNLVFKLSTGLDMSYSARGNYDPKETLHGAQTGGYAEIWNRRATHSSSEFTVTYNLELNSANRFTLLGGYIYEKEGEISTNLSNNEFVTDGFLWNNIGSGTGTKGVGSDGSENLRASYLSRFNYTLLDRYLLTASIRRDGSSTFAVNEKWGIFPSVALGWNIAEENFMQFSSNFLKMAKLRASWGKTGNSNIRGRHNATYDVIQGWTKPDVGSYAAVVPGRVANPDLKWETTTELNFGLDLEFAALKGISATLEYYTKKTEDLLQQRETAAYQYLSSVWANVGATQTQGFEVTVNTRNVMSSKFTWTTDFTFTKFESRWLRHDSQWVPQIYETDAQQVLDPIYAQQAIGILQKADPIPLSQLTPLYGGTGISDLYPGGIIIADINGQKLDENGKPMLDELGKVILTGQPDGKIDQADTRFIGSRTPGFIIGFSNKFVYKAFDLNIYSYGMFDRVMEDQTFSAWGRSTGQLVFAHINALQSIKGRWMDETIFPDRTESTTHSRSGSGDWYYDKAWFIRVQDISLGYTLPRSAKFANTFNSLRIYFDINNAFVITPYTGNDPETDRYAAGYPNVRTFTFGIDMKF